MMHPITSEKIIKIMEAENKVVFVVDKKAGKKEIAKEIKDNFNVTPVKINTKIMKGKKLAYVKIKESAVDLATRFGLM